MTSFIEKVNTIVNWWGLSAIGVVPFGTMVGGGQVEFEMEPNTDPDTKSTCNRS